MYAYIIRRLLFGIVIVWGVYTITFMAVNFAPGDPFTGKENAKISEADLDRLREQWGYNLPRHERYFLHIRKMFWGDPEVLPWFRQNALVFAKKETIAANPNLHAIQPGGPLDLVHPYRDQVKVLDSLDCPRQRLHLPCLLPPALLRVLGHRSPRW